MSLLRTSKFVPILARQCARVAATPQVQQRNYAEMAFTLAGPYAVHYNKASVKQVDVPSFSGSFGILPDHVPLLAVLQPGVVTVYESEATKKYFVSSGSVTINDDASVQVLAEELVTLDSLDMAAIREGIQKSQQEMSAASTDAAKAEAQIALECYEAMAKALD